MKATILLLLVVAGSVVGGSTGFSLDYHQHHHCSHFFPHRRNKKSFFLFHPHQHQQQQRASSSTAQFASNKNVEQQPLRGGAIDDTKNNKNNKNDDDDDNDSVDSNDTRNIPPLIALVGGTTSAVVSGIFSVVLAWKRNDVVLAFFCGSILNAVLSKVLKKLVNQTRPPELAESFADGKVRWKPSDGGMPSSHAMSLGFIGTFTILQLWNTAPWLALFIVGFSAASLYYRIQVRLHTTAQVAVGVTVGSTNAFLFKQYGQAWLIDHVLQPYIFMNTQDGLLPYPLLIVPAVAGVIIVGSVERRISQWIKERRTRQQQEQQQ